MEVQYKPTEIEPKWQKRWEKKKVFAANRNDGEPFYVLEMFPYPSGNLHMGHVSCYSIGDVIARYKRMKGFNVLHPMGWDALGLPAEVAAIQDGIHPKVRTWENIKSVKKQMIRMGFSYDWEREIATCEPEYYKWNQWFFIKMHEMGLVYRRKTWVNWSTGLQTVLANEQVIDGKCWRTGTPVIQKQIPEWAFKITRYAEELLRDLDKLNEWPSRIVTAQRNWIGRSTGAEIHFKIKGREETIPVFTTRIDTIFGATYLVLAPEHDLALSLTAPEKRAEVEEFIEKIKTMNKLERTAEGGKKEGVFTGSYAINPFTKDEIPIWLANFVLVEYGTGAVMSVPAHDQRDFEFAKKYGLPIKGVIKPKGGHEWIESEMDRAFEEYGILYNSGKYSGLTSQEARSAMAEDAKKEGFGRPTVNYKLRDWGFSRQRYWGTPIPVIYCSDGNYHLVEESDLPVILPEKVDLLGEGMTPLGRNPDFVNVECSKCPDGKGKRETETMDTFVDSSWYYARFLSPKDGSQPFSPEEAKKWLPIDVYVGGPEHAVAHLLYFRFWHKVMRDMGLVQSDEPVKKLITQGMVLDWSYQDPETGEYFRPDEVVWDESYNGPPIGPPEKKGMPRSPKTGNPLKVQMEKMSKSKKNGVSPDEMAEEYGADTLRLFILFASPPTKDVEWSEQGVKGCYRFLLRSWRLFHRDLEVIKETKPFLNVSSGKFPENAQQMIESLTGKAREVCRITHQTIKRVTEDIEKRYHFNTAIAALMEMLNYLHTVKLDEDSNIPQLYRDAWESFILMLSPFAPHIAEEMWEKLGYTEMIAETTKWPTYHPAAAKDDLITIVVQINGKLRARIQVPPDLPKEEIFSRAKENQTVQNYISGKDIVREIYVPKKLVNFVVK